MSTVSLQPNGRVLVAVKGAPETIKTMLSSIPDGYDETFKWFTRRGSRVLALGMKEIPSMSTDKVCSVYITNYIRADLQTTVRNRSTIGQETTQRVI